MKKIRLFRTVALAVLSISILINCAKIENPPGGPEDKLGPAIVSTYPLDNSTSVLKDNKISIEFSESVDKESVEKSIYISPRIEEELKYRWKKNSLTINLPDSFKSEMTYVVNLGSGIKDIRNNKMDSSVTIAFSTGETLNSGFVSGMAIVDGKPASGATVALYEIERPDSLTRFDSLYPAYQSQTAKDGSYSLKYLPNGNYYIMAFHDKNNNQLLNLPKESYGLPDRSTQITAVKKISQNFILNTMDTAKVSILTASAAGNNGIRARFSKEIEVENISSSLSDVRLINMASNDEYISGGVKEKPDETSKTITLFFENIPSDSIKLRIGNRLFEQENDSQQFIESPVFEFAAITDTTAPIIEEFSHNKLKVDTSKNILTFYFSEPCKASTLDSDEIPIIEIYDQDSIIYDYSIVENSNRFNLQLRIEDLKWDKNYRVIVNEFRLSDFSGNLSGDSLSVFKFSSYFEDSLGTITGTIFMEDSLKGTPYLILKDIRGSEITSHRADSSQFGFSVLPGKYLLSGFVDRNENGEHDIGSLSPFDYSETYYNHPDTIRVRARFESAGVNVYIK